GRSAAVPRRPVLGAAHGETVRTAWTADNGELPGNDRGGKSPRHDTLEPAFEVSALEGLAREEVTPPPRAQCPIDLPTALQFAESQNPTIALGRQAIVEAVALQTAARGLMLPTLNAGSNYHMHQGVLQTSFGEIRNLNEQALYVGGGARTLAAETVLVPAVRIFSHLGDAIY